MESNCANNEITGYQSIGFFLECKFIG
jgi:hypothetical protein